MKWFVAFAVLVLVGCTAPAKAQIPHVSCTNHDSMVDQLWEKYGEKIVAVGTHNYANTMIEIYAAASGGWSLVVVKPDRSACLIIEGKNWRIRHIGN